MDQVGGFGVEGEMTGVGGAFQRKLPGIHDGDPNGGNGVSTGQPL